MITEKELHEAIAECQGTRNPDTKTCLKLASFYTILDHIAEKEKDDGCTKNMPAPAYSFAPEIYQSDTEFGEVIQSLSTYETLEIMDELMSTLSIVEPRLYASVMRKLRGQI